LDGDLDAFIEASLKQGVWFTTPILVINISYERSNEFQS
jgi:hypothetical protein